MIAAMLLEAGDHSRDIARKSRDAALEAEAAACAKKIHAMKDAAQDEFLAGAIGAAGTGLSGLASISAAVRPNTDSRLFTGSGGIAEGLSKGGTAYWNWSSGQAEQEEATAERAMTQAKREVESASDQEKDAKDLLRRTLDHYKDFLTAKNEASQAALFRA
jgi:hypothetical protein